MKSVERVHNTLIRSILHLSIFRNSNFLPKLISIYVFSILLLSVIFIPSLLVINADGKEDDDLKLEDDDVVDEQDDDDDDLKLEDDDVVDEQDDDDDDLKLEDDDVVDEQDDGDGDENDESEIKDEKPSISENNTIKKFVFNKNKSEESDGKINLTEKPNIEKSFESNLGDITENEKISVETPTIEKTETCIQKVDFTPSQHQKNVKLQVSNLEGKPEEVQKDLNISNTSKVYKWLDIKLTSNELYIGETGIKNMTFSFSVEKSWIENQSFDKFTIKMMRYHDDEWQELNTSYTNETEDLVYYQADTPGLSVFAVVGNKVVEDSDEIVVESSHMPWWMPASVIFVS
ncbi:MAG: PGF-pre-PGF domain-containing protein, partial [Candidatus Thermoplasmatota archaeon]|nr:PGF-pre-PGF domain-containing protein [Candidatus Thermoplasmatota archaeon]